MSDRPLLFRGEMVRALLDGRKTQTRRPAWRVKIVRGAGMLSGHRDGATTTAQRIKVGDLIWVRETGSFTTVAGKHAVYAADVGASHGGLGWTPSIHMPRWASRLTLIVTGVKIERLQDISEADAAAEGMFHFSPMPEFGGKSLGWTYQNGAPAKHLCDTARNAFGLFYCLIHGESAWDANPEVVAITFTVDKQNIDALSKAEAA